MRSNYNSPLRGKYLIQNRWANWAMRGVDMACSLWTLGSKKQITIQPPQKILLSNLGHLGDVILMTSLLPVIKQALPQVQIGVIVGSWAKCIVHSHPLIDFIHVLDHWKVSRSETTLYQKIRRTRALFHRALQEIKETQYDISVECNFHFPNTIFLTYRANIPTRIGYTSGGFGPLLTHPTRWTKGQGSVARYALNLLLPFLSIEPSTLKPYLPIESTPLCLLPQPYFVIHMGAGHAIREWPLPKWKELCIRLLAEGHHLVFTGKGAEEAKAIEWVSRGLSNTTNLCDSLAWQEWVNIIKNADLLVAVDTSAGHIAAASDTPMVLIYHGLHPPELWGPLHANRKFVIYPTSCSPCYSSRGCASMSCIRQIDVESVLTAIYNYSSPKM